MIEFEYLWAFVLLPVPLVIYRFVPSYQTKQQAIKVPFFTRLLDHLPLKAGKGAIELKPSRWQRFSLILGWVLIVVSAAKPMWLGEEQTRELSGRDLMIVVDLSGSMSTTDFSGNDGIEVSRLSAAKSVLAEFSTKRESDRLGLIVFGDKAYLQSPFTADHSVWLNLLNETEVAMAGQSTHLGDAIGLALKTFGTSAHASHLNQATKQQLVIVLTDGNDTDSMVAPLDAAKIAAQRDVRIHMVAMGSPNTQGEQALDLAAINDVADTTGGRAFLAQSPAELDEIYSTINELEPQVFESFRFQPKVSLHYIPILVLLINHLVFMSFSIWKRKKRETLSVNGECFDEHD